MSITCLREGHFYLLSDDMDLKICLKCNHLAEIRLLKATLAGNKLLYYINPYIADRLKDLKAKDKDDQILPLPPEKP